MRRVRSPRSGSHRTRSPTPSSRAFVEATGYVTEAETFGWSFVFAGLLPDDFRRHAGRRRGALVAPGRGRRLAPPGRPAVDPRRDGTSIRWCTSPGTTPSPTAPGPASACPPRPSGSTRARGGLEGQRYPWGDELEPGGEHRMNVWQGTFPTHNTLDDGYPRHRAGRRLPAERLRPPQHDRQRLGVVRRLVQPRVLRPRRARRTRRGRQRARTGSCAAAPTSATPRTAAATGSRPATQSRPTPRPATSASAARPPRTGRARQAPPPPRPEEPLRDPEDGRGAPHARIPQARSGGATRPRRGARDLELGPRCERRVAPRLHRNECFAILLRSNQLLGAA